MCYTLRWGWLFENFWRYAILRMFYLFFVYPFLKPIEIKKIYWKAPSNPVRKEGKDFFIYKIRNEITNNIGNIRCIYFAVCTMCERCLFIIYKSILKYITLYNIHSIYTCLISRIIITTLSVLFTYIISKKSYFFTNKNFNLFFVVLDSFVHFV